MRASETPCALVIVTASQGSTPREVGARMIVADGRIVWGTIGGGRLEQIAIEESARLLAKDGSGARSIDIPLAESAGQCCGGRVTLLVETFRWRPRRVVIFGAGHVGQSLAGLGPWMRASVQVIDARAENELNPAPDPERTWELVHTRAPVQEVAHLPLDAAVLVMTHRHDLDLDILHAALRRGSFPYLGLIGSRRKWARFRARLLERGHAERALEAVTCPIGVSLGPKEPSAIALSAATQLVEHFARHPKREKSLDRPV